MIAMPVVYQGNISGVITFVHTSPSNTEAAPKSSPLPIWKKRNMLRHSLIESSMQQATVYNFLTQLKIFPVKKIIFFLSQIRM